MRAAAATTGVIALAALAATGGCGADSPPPPGRAPATAAAHSAPGHDSSLLFVSLDTFRGDAAGSGGDPAAFTPHLDRLARGGLQFRNGIAPTPLTLPSHASMLTGQDPPGHGVRDNGTFRLGEDVPTFPPGLRAAGVRTAAFLAAFPLDGRFGLAPGFEVYDDEVGERGSLGMFAMDQRSGEAAVAAAAAWIRAVPAAERLFAWIHLFDAHTPWDAPAPLRAAAGGDAYRGDVALADRALGGAVRLAEERGNTWIVVFGDHGESLGDHGEAKHGLFIYGATTQVPAVVWPAPAGRPAGLIDATFRAVDVGATVRDLLGLPPGEAPGTGASALAGGNPSAYLESYYAYYHYGWAPLRAVQDPDWKYVDAPQPELYDLRADPGERRNVVAEHPGRAAEMAARVRERAGARAEAVPLELDDAARQALESLGYVTSAAGTGPEELPEEDRPDPKRMVVVQNLIETAQAHLSAGRLEPTLAALRNAMARDPDNKDVSQTYATAYALAGRWADAIDFYDRALGLPPHRNDPAIRFELATALIRAGAHERAVAELEEVLREGGDEAAAAHNLGVALDALGRREDAVRAWTRALAADPAYELSRQALERAGAGSR